MSKLFVKGALTFLVASTSFFSFADLFQNAYITFNKPSNWKCVLEGAEWVCFSRLEAGKNKKRSGTVILTAKEKGPFDNINSYTNYLKTPKALPSKTGKPHPAKVYNVNQKMVDNHLWVDALHFGSQVPNYYTRYLATVKGQLAILVTLSAHKDHYAKYSKDFVNIVKSLKIVSKGITSKNSVGVNPVGSGGILGNGSNPGDILDDSEFPDEPSKKKGSDMGSVLLGIAIILASLGFYLFKKKRENS